MPVSPFPWQGEGTTVWMQEVEQRREQLSRMGVDCLLDAGRYGLTHMDVLMPQSQGCERAAHVLGFGILRRSTAYIHIGVLRHFLHPVGRFHQHDDEDTYSDFPEIIQEH